MSENIKGSLTFFRIKAHAFRIHCRSGDAPYSIYFINLPMWEASALTVSVEMDCCHGPPRRYSSCRAGSFPVSIAKAMSLERDFGKHGVIVLVVVAGATLPLGRDEDAHCRSLLPKDALGTVVVAAAHAMFGVSPALGLTFSCTKPKY